MWRQVKILQMVLPGILSALLLASEPVLAEQRTLSGMINGSDQLITPDGKVYEIADTELGMEMLYHALEASVSVTGDVVEDEEINFITVDSFTITDPQPMEAEAELQDEETDTGSESDEVELDADE